MPADGETPIACSLDGGELRARLAEIASVGAAALLGREEDGDRHTLRFRDEPETARRLRAIVAAEAECCSFLELSLEERGGELILTLAAPAGGEPVAGELARAFGDAPA